MLQRCLTKAAEVSLEIRIKLLTFETILEWYKPSQTMAGKLNHKGEKQQKWETEGSHVRTNVLKKRSSRR